jgi:hypothetical protein
MYLFEEHHLWNLELIFVYSRDILSQFQQMIIHILIYKNVRIC